MIFDKIELVLGKIKLLLFKLIYWNRIFWIKKIKVNFFSNFYIYKTGKMILGKNFKSRKNSSFYCINGEIKIGDNCFFSNNCMISCQEKIIIGDNCFFGNNVSIYDNDHDYKNNMNDYVTEPISIGNNVWCGCSAIILKGVEIGDNCTIGAGTIITKSVPSNSIIYSKSDNIVREK